MKCVKILLSLLMILASCKKLKPAGFWEGYQELFMKKNVSEFGPYGGFRAMYWHASERSSFSIHDILKFAQNNGWQCVDTILISSDTLAKHLVGSKSYFPFSYTDFSNMDNLELEFPRWINSDVVLYRCRTEWLAVQPGNAIQTEINGYIVISADSLQFSVYHLWGE